MHEVTNVLAMIFAVDPDVEPEPKKKGNKKRQISWVTYLIKMCVFILSHGVKDWEVLNYVLPDCKDRGCI